MELIEKKNDFYLISDKGEFKLSKKKYFLIRHILENRGKVLETDRLARQFGIEPATLRNYVNEFRQRFGVKMRRVTGFMFEE